MRIVVIGNDGRADALKKRLEEENHVTIILLLLS